MTQPEHGQRVCHRNGAPRIVTAVVVWLLLGAIVNVAVAWGCARWIKYPGSVRITAAGNWETETIRLDEPIGKDGFYKRWVWIRQPWWGVEWKVVTIVGDEEEYNYPAFEAGLKPDFTVAELRILESEWRLHGIEPGFYCIHASGWPVPALQSEWPWFQQKDLPNPRVSWGLQFEENSDTGHIYVTMFQLRAIPLKPIWPGFAINTIFYAAVLWVLFALPAALRRRSRIKRGLCPKCAYPVGESMVCTECGRPVIGSAIIDRNGQG